MVMTQLNNIDNKIIFKIHFKYIVTDFNLLRHQGTMMAGASMELFRLTFDLISKYLNISVTFHTLIAWPGSGRLYFLSDIVSLSQMMVP